MRLLLAMSTVAAGLGASTLELLSTNDLIAKSTAIVRARVTAEPSGFLHRGMIYSRYRLAVLETLKGPNAATLDVAVPGGVISGLRQTVAGAPGLRANEEYVFFLWTSRTGLTQIIGLTQGLFAVKAGGSGAVMLSRGPASEPVVDPATGRRVEDKGLEWPLEDLKRRLRAEAAKQ
jgi:hypothetical protein